MSSELCNTHEHLVEAQNEPPKVLEMSPSEVIQEVPAIQVC